MVEEVKKTVEKKQEEAKLVDVPTQYSVAVQLENGDVVSQDQLLVEIYNLLKKIHKVVG